MSAVLRHPVAIAAVILALTGCGVRVSLGELVIRDLGADGGIETDAADPFDAAELDASSEAEPLEASDDVFVDDGSASDVTVD